MLETLQQLIRSEPWAIALELLLIWICVAFVFRFLQGTRGAGIIKGFAVLFVVATLLFRMLAQGSDAFARLSFLYEKFLGLLAILLIVVFQQELRQAMIRIGHAWTFRVNRGTRGTVIDAVTEAVGFLSKSQFGALIAIERSSRLGGLIETGTEIDAKVSADLLKSIFWPSSPLHDLGVVVRGDRIVAASVQFPLVEEGALDTRFGSRHRAAAGLSLEADCVVVIVSEETGAISIAERGRLDHDIDRKGFRAELAARLEARRAPEAEEPPAESGEAKEAAGTAAEGSAEHQAA